MSQPAKFQFSIPAGSNGYINAGPYMASILDGVAPLESVRAAICGYYAGQVTVEGDGVTFTVEFPAAFPPPAAMDLDKFDEDGTPKIGVSVSASVPVVVQQPVDCPVLCIQRNVYDPPAPPEEPQE